MEKRNAYLVPAVIVGVAILGGAWWFMQSRQPVKYVGPAGALNPINAVVPGQGQVNVNGNSYNYTSPTGDKMVVGQNVQIPANFPSDVPVYPGAKVVTAIVAATENGASLNLTTPDTAAKVGAWYDGQLTGWTKSTAGNYGGGEMRSYTKGGFAISLMTVSQGGLTSITVVKAKQ